ncbi:GGDEF domain-containing protein [Paenibacillus periandrae]|uniref:GGDEF domain-containing protein n=1 Tax=Paenibacillus periandrae TaxID=1761741 RepID=UPI001F08E734|nr:GGDEF domain-containing protein [Paenibacillus periandrae]
MFGLKLTLTLIIFAASISFSIAVSDQIRLRDQASKNKLEQVEQYEKMAKYALETIEKAYELFGNQIADKMREKSYALLDKYKSNPSFVEWDFAQLKEDFAMDVYIINSENVITYSSFEKDISLDFAACCRKMVPILEERRTSGEFYHDGIDTEQTTGYLKKYSYIATPDMKYIIQLGYSIENSAIFTEFNFLSKIKQFVNNYPSINEVNVLNIGGNRLGEPVSETRKLSQERRAAFEQTLRSGDTTEYRGEWNGDPVIFRYVHYMSDYDTGTTKSKILEIIYNEKDLFDTLRANQRDVVIQLTIVLIITVALSLVISRWVARPMYLAFHDSLTGLKNRAAFDDAIKSAIAKDRGTTGLLMIDLDNFKLVNDQLGHDSGDQLLKCVAGCIRSIARKQDVSIRLGGDEFVLILPFTSKRDAGDTAQKIIDEIVARTEGQFPLQGGKVTVSIGISLFPEHGRDSEVLSKNADKALYVSKQMGKNQYNFYETK